MTGAILMLKTKTILVDILDYNISAEKIYEPHNEKTCLRDFRPGLTQTGLYSHKRHGLRLEILDLGSTYM